MIAALCILAWAIVCGFAWALFRGATAIDRRREPLL
jgi:hypothetical protein